MKFVSPPEELKSVREAKSECTYSRWDGAIVGEACKECGHTNLVHPGHHNPSLEVCLFCELKDKLGKREDVNDER